MKYSGSNRSGGYLDFFLVVAIQTQKQLRVSCVLSRKSLVGRSSFPAVFLFLYFLFSFFYKNIFLFSKFTEIYPGCRAAGIRSPCCVAAGAFLQKFSRKICAPAPGGPVARQRGGRPPCRSAVGRQVLAARQQGDRLPHPYIRVGWSPHPSFASLQFQKQRKKREGGREAKPCRIFEPATAGNQNSSTLYK